MGKTPKPFILFSGFPLFSPSILGVFLLFWKHPNFNKNKRGLRVFRGNRRTKKNNKKSTFRRFSLTTPLATLSAFLGFAVCVLLEEFTTAGPYPIDPQRIHAFIYLPLIYCLDKTDLFFGSFMVHVISYWIFIFSKCFITPYTSRATS